MFQGIIESVSLVRGLDQRRLSIKLPRQWKLVPGESVAVNGACLTVVKIQNSVIEFDLGQETLRLTNLGKLKKTDKVNLERSLRFGERISGHLVLGHIDALGELKKSFHVGNSLILEFFVQGKKLPIAPKGSIAIDGVSLTVNGTKKIAEGVFFDVCLIPETIKRTILGIKPVGHMFNIETDYLLRSLNYLGSVASR